VFNSKRTMPAALASVVQSEPGLVVVGQDEQEAMCAVVRAPSRNGGPDGPSTTIQRDVATLAFDSSRYVGARIGIFDPSGRKVGRVGHLSNQELLVIAGEAAMVRRVVEAVGSPAAAVAALAAPAAPTRAAAAAVAPSMVDRLQQAT
jgi:adenine-specific DNA-methyltransferase